MKKVEYQINGKTWTIEYNESSREIVDVHVHLTSEEYLKLKKKLPDPEIDFKNSASIELLRNGFAKARGEAALESKKPEEVSSEILSTFLDVLEKKSTTQLEKLSRSINGSYESPLDKIKELTSLIEQYNC